MLHRIRLAMHKKDFVRLGGKGAEVEVDETFIGGAARFMHADRRKKVITERGVKDKAAVFGILERGGEVRANVIPTLRKHILQGEIRRQRKAQSPIYSRDEPYREASNHLSGTHWEGHRYRVPSLGRDAVNEKPPSPCLFSVYSLSFPHVQFSSLEKARLLRARNFLLPSVLPCIPVS